MQVLFTELKPDAMFTWAGQLVQLVNDNGDGTWAAVVTSTMAQDYVTVKPVDLRYPVGMTPLVGQQAFRPPGLNMRQRMVQPGWEYDQEV
jgi:hypothetical protein